MHIRSITASSPSTDTTYDMPNPMPDTSIITAPAPPVRDAPRSRGNTIFSLKSSSVRINSWISIKTFCTRKTSMYIS